MPYIYIIEREFNGSTNDFMISQPIETEVEAKKLQKQTLNQYFPSEYPKFHKKQIIELHIPATEFQMKYGKSGRTPSCVSEGIFNEFLNENQKYSTIKTSQSSANFFDPSSPKAANHLAGFFNRLNVAGGIPTAPVEKQEVKFR